MRYAGGRADGGVAGHSDRQRQPVVSQLADAGCRSWPASTTGSGGGFSRRALVARATRRRAAATPGARAGVDRRDRADRRDRGAQRRAGAQHALRLADHEHARSRGCRSSTPTARSAASVASARSWCSKGRRDETITPQTKWLPYEFKCQPGDPARRPCWMSPYHYRLDWLLWFAAMGSPRDYPWAAPPRLASCWRPIRRRSVCWPPIRFTDAPPRYVRVDLYRYSLAPLGSEGLVARARASALGLPPLARRSSISRTTCATKVG